MPFIHIEFQESKLFKLASTKATSVSVAKLLKKCFYFLKFQDREYVIPVLPPLLKCPVLIRAEMDLDQIVKRFIAIRRTLLISKIRLLNRKYQSKLTNQARKTMTFKMFIAKLNDDVNRRLFNEMSVISDAFEDRGALGNTHSLIA